MRILVTGSSGEIGTTLALRLQEEGHDVFGVDRRPNTWTDAFPYALQDLAQRFVNFQGGIGDVIYPEHIDVVVHLAANAKVHELAPSLREEGVVRSGPAGQGLQWRAREL